MTYIKTLCSGWGGEACFSFVSITDNVKNIKKQDTSIINVKHRVWTPGACIFTSNMNSILGFLLSMASPSLLCLFFFSQYHKPVYRPNHCLLSVLCTRILSLCYFWFSLSFGSKDSLKKVHFLGYSCFFLFCFSALIVIYTFRILDWSSILLHWHSIDTCKEKRFLIHFHFIHRFPFWD